MSTAVSGLRMYDLFDADQMQVVADLDALPDDAEARGRYLRMLAMDATIYGLPSVFQYAQLFQQAVDVTSESYTGFNEFLHQRELATPEFDAFKTPNVDTLYSNAWLDLSGGPVVVEVPPVPQRYYTLQVVDMYGNSTNLSSRTVGPGGGRFLVATTTWDGDVPADATVFRVATPYMWILMRILVKSPGEDEKFVQTLQDLVTITPLAERVDVAFPAVTFDDVQTRAMPFFQALDWTIRNNGHPIQEEGYVQRFRSIGIGTPEPFDPSRPRPSDARQHRGGLRRRDDRHLEFTGTSRHPWSDRLEHRHGGRTRVRLPAPRHPELRRDRWQRGRREEVLRQVP